MCKKAFLLALAVLVLGVASNSRAEFGAYYCRLNSGQAWESDARVGPYADVVVHFDNASDKLVFWRASSYLPQWQSSGGNWYVQEIVSRSGDGGGLMPDKTNKYSRVRIIETSPARVVVHWRYIPDFGNPNWAGWVDEYYTIYPDGVCIRTIRRGADKLDNWLSPANLTVQRLKLESSGISNLPTSWQNTPGLLLSGQSAGKYDNKGFDTAKRCYLLKCRKNGTPSVLQFTLDTAGGKSLHNPVVVVKNWGDARASVNVEGGLAGNYRTGYANDTDSTDLIVWMSKQSSSPIDVTISPRGGTRPKNKVPRVDAGRDQSILAASASSGPYIVGLEGVVTDDGLPNDNLTITWSRLSGPDTANFTNAHDASTSVTLSADGTYNLRLTADDGSKAAQDDVIIVVKKDPGVVGSPAAWWKFNEGSGDATQESVRPTSCTIGGPKSLWKAGVSGTALQFDGYDSVVTLPPGQAPPVSSGLTVEAWVALGARPWNWAPIVHHSEWESRGYYLGVDAYGHLGFMLKAGGWQRLTAGSLERYKWTHVVGTYDPSSGKMYLYIDGSQAGSRSASGSIEMAGGSLLIGRNNAAIQPTDAVRDDATLPTMYGFDGLIDEVKIYNRALSLSEVSSAYNKNRPDTLVCDNPAMQERVLPSGPPDTNRFGAYYANLKYYETWDNMWRVSEHPDVVVKFDESPATAVFWRGTSFGSGWVSENNKWLSDQSVEEGGGGTLGCCEHMSDKQCRHAHVRIIESTAARAIVHWRYSLVDILYNQPRKDSHTGWADWVDEYFTIYPDAAGVRNVKYWSSDYGHYSLQDTQFLTPPGVRPEDIIELSSLTVVTQDGQTRTLSWAGGVPDNPLHNANIEMVNLKSEYKPFVMFEVGPHINPWGESEKNDYTYWPTWNHWPVAQALSDGRLATYHDRLTHSALGEVDIDDIDTDIMMYGVTNQSAASLATLAKSWNEAPSLNVISAGFSSEGYDRGQRAYILRQNSSEPAELQFTLQGSGGSPICNPCFVVKNWKGHDKVSLTVDGQEVPPGPDFRQGIENSTDCGTASLVVWVKKEATVSTNIKISPSAGLTGDLNGDGAVNLLDFALFVEDADWLVNL